MSSSNSPCAACKFLRRKCTLNCVFAPYFPPDQPSKFANVHRVFGASNVAKLLADLPLVHREDAVNSLAYEANARLRDPVYGCIGEISQLQHRLKCIQIDLFNAKKELAQYMGGTNNTLPAQFLTGGGVVVNNQNHHQNQIQIIQLHGFHGGVGPTSGIEVPQPQQPQSRILLHEQQQQLIEAMQMATAAAREQELFRGFDQQQPHQHQLDEYARYAAAAAVGVEGGENGNFNQIGNVRVLPVTGEQQSGLGLVPQGFDNTFQLHQHQQLQKQHQQQQQHQQYYRDQQQEEQKVECEEEGEQQRQRQRPAHDHHQRTGSDKDRSSDGSVIGPSC